MPQRSPFRSPPQNRRGRRDGSQATYPLDTRFSRSRASCSTTSRPCSRIPMRGARRSSASPKRCGRIEPDLLVGIESRGFLVAAPLAYALGSGFAMVRKQGQTARQNRRASPTISNTAPTRSRCRRTRSRRASGSSCSTICWRPAERCRRRSISCVSAAATSAAAACIIELCFLKAAAASTCRSRRWSPTTADQSAIVAAARTEAAADHRVKRVAAAGGVRSRQRISAQLPACDKMLGDQAEMPGIVEQAPAADRRGSAGNASRMSRPAARPVSTPARFRGSRRTAASNTASRRRSRRRRTRRSANGRLRIAVQILYLPLVEKRVFRQLCEH